MKRYIIKKNFYNGISYKKGKEIKLEEDEAEEQPGQPGATSAPQTKPEPSLQPSPTSKASKSGENQGFRP